MRDKLLKQGIDAGQRAIRHYLKKEYDQFFIQAGVSFELLGKARLATIHPSLIIDRDFDSFLHACGAGEHAKRTPPWKVRTITATEVLKRCSQVQPEVGSFDSQLTLLADYRNSTIHLGEVPEVEVTRVLRAYLAAASALGKVLALEPETIFGEFVEFVSKQLDESLAEVQRVVAEKLAHARDEFRQRYAALDPGQLQSLIQIIEGVNTNPFEKYTYVDRSCPACENNGILSGDYDIDWQPDDFDEGGSPHTAYPVVTLNTSFFVCNVCGLELDGVGELKAAGLEDSVGLEDVDPADFYEDYDEYR